MIKKMMYNRMRRKLVKGIKHKYNKTVEVTSVILEAFNPQDRLIVTVITKDTPPITDKMILSEQGDFINIFTQKIKKHIDNYKEPIYTKLLIDYETKKELVNMTYIDNQNQKHPFNYKSNF